jgi:hypothetical protein
MALFAVSTIYSNPFLLYVQTTKLIEISITGTYKLIIFQLYPSTVKTLFDGTKLYFSERFTETVYG